MNVAIITIGNEILLGKTINTNMAYLGSQLATLGFNLELAKTIKDDPETIKKALQDTWGKFEVVITTGGLGPTEDDLTKATIADFFGCEIHFDEAVWNHVQSLFAKRDLPTPENNRCQAMVPDGFTALENARGTAPGLHYCKDGKHFFALQGVPVEMQYIFETHIVGILKHYYPKMMGITQRTLHTHGISESRLAELFFVKDLPADVSVAWLPQTGRVDMRFYGYYPEAVDIAINRALKSVGSYVWGVDNETPAQVLLQLLSKKSNTISVAESCTGGLVGKLLSDIPGSSNSFMGGVIAYHDEIKINVLNVSSETLFSQGAVSEQCATEMVAGIKALTKSNYALSLTGIAGPGGGTELKPIGSVHFGFAAKDFIWSKKQVFNGDRNSIRFKAAEYAILELIRHEQCRD